ncbi:MAG: AzlD domain-containing protein [Hyphomicrobiales bacterium]|nr:AzlD domain-containing protein [Hyphomicrobiales bacterium]
MIDTAPGPWSVIFATALVTFLLRVSGYWLMARVPVTPRVKRALDALPASLFISTVAPIALKAGVAGVAATLAAAAVMFLAKREMPALATGFAVAAALRALGL